MAMAHPVPGLGKRKFFKHRPIASAPPDIVRLRGMLRPLDQEEIETIRVRTSHCAKSWLLEEKVKLLRFPGQDHT